MQRQSIFDEKRRKLFIGCIPNRRKHKLFYGRALEIFFCVSVQYGTIKKSCIEKGINSTNFLYRFPRNSFICKTPLIDSVLYLFVFYCELLSILCCLCQRPVHKL